MTWTVASLARALGLEVAGPPADADVQVISRVAALAQAGPGDVAFAASTRYQAHLAATRASAVIVRPDLASGVPTLALIADNPHLAFARAAALLHPDPAVTGAIAPSADVAADARIAAPVDIGAGVSIGAGVRIAAGVRLEPGVRVDADSVIGPDCHIGANVVIGPRTRLGARVRIHPGAIVGSEGFGNVWDDGDGWVRVPQVGGTIIGDDVSIGANTTIDRGALDDTVIGDGVVLDNLIQIAHNVRIGDHTAIAGCVGIAGSTVIGRRCTIAGKAAIVGHIEIGDDVHITAQARVTHSVRQPGVYSSGTPVEEHGAWRRNAARFRQLDALARRLRRLGG